MNPVGLRVDVDTLRGTRLGVPNLLAQFARHNIHASFFFSVGPDNMGRNLWRLLRPRFLLKMLRTNAASLYGWDILLRGTMWPGPKIGIRCASIIRQTAKDGHEVGLHAWDHHRWQASLSRLSASALKADLQKGFDTLTRILGKQPDCFAAPAWQVTDEALEVLNQFDFRYESDCRGTAPFIPVLHGERLHHPQVPTTLPTYDEMIGLACSKETYNEHLLSLLKPEGCNVLTIHAEVEGVACADQFAAFLEEAAKRSITFAPLGHILAHIPDVQEAAMGRLAIPGREGWLSCQEDIPQTTTKFDDTRS